MVRPVVAPPRRHVRAVVRRVLLLLPAVLFSAQALPAGAHADAKHIQLLLRQPPQAQIASALDLAAENALPTGYPALSGAPTVPTVLLKAVAWVESQWQQF